MLTQPGLGLTFRSSPRGTATRKTLPEPFGPKYHERVANGYTGDECAICGRRTGRDPLLAHVVDGGTRFIAADDHSEDETPGDMYWFPVGSECAKAFPAGFLSRGTEDEADEA